MSVTYKVWEFPALKISKQVFHVPGAATEGGFTTGGTSIISPEPGGRSMLELQLSLQVDEWENPWSSWLMSKTNGQIFRVKLANTPQVVSRRNIVDPMGGSFNGRNGLWVAPNDADELTGTFASSALEGSNTITIDMSTFGNVLRFGHVIGHSDNCYLVDDIAYVGSVATITVTPPFRKNVGVGETALFKPYFLGTINNGAEIRAMYEAANDGAIQLERIIFSEVIL